MAGANPKSVSPAERQQVKAGGSTEYPTLGNGRPVLHRLGPSADTAKSKQLPNRVALISGAPRCANSEKTTCTVSEEV